MVRSRSSFSRKRACSAWYSRNSRASCCNRCSSLCSALKRSIALSFVSSSSPSSSCTPPLREEERKEALPLRPPPFDLRTTVSLGTRWLLSSEECEDVWDGFSLSVGG